MGARPLPSPSSPTATVAAGGTGKVTFVANIPDIFEVEFERSHKLLFTLEVRS